MNRKALLLAGALMTLVMPRLAAQQTGPIPTPERQEDWPGRGVAGVYPHWTQLREAFWKDRVKDQGAVVFFGDSITEGWRELPTSFPELKTANRGIGSDSSRRLLYRLKEDVLDLHPRAVVMLIGINDLAAGVLPSDVAWNIRHIVDALRADNPKTPVILCHVMPWKPVPGKSPERILELNRLIDGIAIGRPQVAVCDTYSIYATPEGFARREEFPDLLHPTAAARVKWATALRPVMTRLGILPKS